MPKPPLLQSALQDKIIALPESRQLDILAALFERRGARVLRVPLIAIQDSPNQQAVISWIREFIADKPDHLIALTGEGLRRLLAAAKRHNLDQQFIATLVKVNKICRGPKPGRALKEMGLEADMLAASPTTSGVIETLANLELRNSRIAVQLYGEDPNQLLIDYLGTRELQDCSTVAPYVYASDSENERVIDLIHEMARGRVDLIAFTSQPQVRRLFKVSKDSDLEATLRRGFEHTRIAAIGPVVADILAEFGCQVSVMPTESYFMKPLVTAVETLFSTV